MRQKSSPHRLADLALTLSTANVTGLESENKGVLQPLRLILCQNGVHTIPDEALLSPPHQQRRQRNTRVTHPSRRVHITSLGTSRRRVHRVERHLVVPWYNVRSMLYIYDYFDSNF